MRTAKTNTQKIDNKQKTIVKMNNNFNKAWDFSKTWWYEKYVIPKEIQFNNSKQTIDNSDNNKFGNRPL